MLIHKLRLQHGWSQEQLAEVSGVSVRTIQRLEQGKSAATETLKALGAALGVPFHDLRTSTMETPSDMTSETTAPVTHPIFADEVLALHKMRKIRRFYTHIVTYGAVMTLLAIANIYTASDGGPIWVVWPALGWGIAIVLNGLKTFNVLPMYSPEWEKRKVEELLGRKL